MGIEDRRHERLDIAIEVRVRGLEKNGKPFSESTLSGDISTSGCSLFLSYNVAAGAELELEFLHRVPDKKEPRVLPFRGKVVRITPVNAVQYTMGIQSLNGVFPAAALER